MRLTAVFVLAFAAVASAFAPSPLNPGVATRTSTITAARNPLKVKDRAPLMQTSTLPLEPHAIGERVQGARGLAVDIGSR